MSERKGLHYRHDEYVGVIEYGEDDGEWVGGVEVEYEGEEWPCDWHVRITTEDGYSEKPCGAPALTTEGGGFECRVGHAYTPMEIRRRDGWEYAEDEGEARRLRGLGIAVVETF